MRIFASLLLVLAAAAASAQHLVKQEVFNAIANEYSGEGAQENTRRIVEYHRIQGSPMMASVASEVVLPRLKAAGLEAQIEQFTSDGKTRYGTYISPMGWDMRGGELWVEGVGGMKDFTAFRLCRYSDVPMCVSTYSKGGDWSGELVDVGSGTSAPSYAGKEVRGKVALAYGYAAAVVRQAVLQHGAVGVVIYPAAEDRPDHPDMVRYNGIWPRAEELEKTSGGFQISRNQYDQLRALMSRGPVRVHGRIDATLGPGKLTLVHAWIRGTERPAREVLITGHLDHPKWSANDNASGSGAMIEAARALAALISAKKIPAPRVTIHFMWVPEYFGTLAYVSNHPNLKRCPRWDDEADQRNPDQSPCIIANINADMVGEDTVKTGSRFYFTRTPDSVPPVLDGLLNDLLQQTREANLHAGTGTHNYWPTEAIAYAQGSDHDVFLGLGIPATMLGHDPDWTHHTSEDKMDKTDASEFLRVGALASAAGYWLAHAGPEEWRQIDAAQSAVEAGVRAQRVAADLAGERAPTGLAGEMTSASAGRVQRNLAALQRAAARLDAGRPDTAHTLQAQLTVLPRGPQRLALLPLDASAFEGISAADGQWLAQQGERFASDSEGLAAKPNFALISFEAINFMNGHRTTGQIAELLSDEYLVDINQAWVERLVGILEKQKIVNEKPYH